MEQIIQTKMLDDKVKMRIIHWYLYFS